MEKNNFSNFLHLLNQISWKIGQSIQDWGEQLLYHLAKETDAMHGALFSADGKQQNLFLTAGYALQNPEKNPQKIKFGDGLVGFVAKNQETKIVTEKIPNQFSNFILGEKYTPKSIILIPIIFNEITYGVIEFSRNSDFNEKDKFFFESIIQLIGVQLILLFKEQQQKVLLQNLNEKNEEINEQSNKLKKLNDEISDQKKELEQKNRKIGKSLRNVKTITELGQKITSVFDLTEVNKIAYDFTSTLMEISGFGIAIYDEIHELLEFYDLKCEHQTIPYLKRKLSDNTLSVWCFKNSKHILVKDFDSEHEKINKGVISHEIDCKPKSFIYVPLIVKEKTVGILTVFNMKPNMFLRDDLVNLKAVASYIAIALDNTNAYNIIKTKNTHISESINYGKKIQNAILPVRNKISEHFENFVLFLPRDVVSGDFYWFTHQKINGKKYNFLAAVDCTGHGVPGAFLSLIGSSLLNEIVKVKKIYEPKEILEELDFGIKSLLQQEHTKHKDGMDVCLCRVEKIKQKNTTYYKTLFSGAKRPLIYFKDNKIHRQKGSNKTIGMKYKTEKKFEQTEFNFISGNTIYLTSDGFTDQCNPERQKIGTPKFLEILEKGATEIMFKQKDMLAKELFDFQKAEKQRDDIVVVGIRFR